MQVVTLEEVLDDRNLPSLPRVALDVIEMTRDPQVGVADIAEVIRYDQALTGRILKTVNAPWFGLSHPCPSLPRALAYLGLNTVKSIVLGFSLVDTRVGPADGFDLVGLWRRAVLAATAARELAPRIEGCDPDEVFAAALIQDIGMIAIHNARPTPYRAVLRAAGGDHARLPELERQALGFTHAEVGAALAERWRLSAAVVTAVREHHRSVEGTGAEGTPASLRAGVDALAIAVRVALALGDQTPGRASPDDALPRVTDEVSALTGLAPAGVAEVLGRVARDAATLSTLLGLDETRAVDVERVLTEAREARRAHANRMKTHALNVRQAHRRLASACETDILTRVGSRARFDHELSEGHEIALRYHGCLGLILVETDRAASIVDIHGMEAGDAIATEVARRIDRCAHHRGVVCRYDDFVFAILMAGADGTRAAALAESIRSVIADAPFDVGHVTRHRGGGGGRPLDLTASLGVAALEPTAAYALRRPEILLRAADRARYAAIRAGRNRVRTFRVKPMQQAPVPRYPRGMLVAITRAVGPGLGDCELTHLERAPIDTALAARQHEAYGARLHDAGCDVRTLPAEPAWPDSVFVEDAAVVLDELAVITRPGAPSRRAETASVAAALAPFRPLVTIDAPGTLDGGDVARLGRTLLVGRSSRTNRSGREQLREHVAPHGYRVVPIEVSGCLHLKSACCPAGAALAIVNPARVDRDAIAAAWPEVELIDVDPDEPDAANVLPVAATVLAPDAWPRTIARLRAAGAHVTTLDVSELLKAESGVTCSSLIFDVDEREAASPAGSAG